MGMSPWDSARYFQTPVVGNVQATVNSSLAIAADPTRVLLVFSTQGAAVVVSFSPFSPAVLSTGITLLQTGTSQIVMDFERFGSLVNSAWFVVSSAPTQVSVLSLSLTDWPKGANNGRQTTVNAAILQRLDRLIQLAATRTESA